MGSDYTMNARGREILDCLQTVARERERRSRDPALAAAVHAIKVYQHTRFTHTYADLLQQPRYASAARFFLEELYGPKDFGQRDAQFARIVPGLVRLFPDELVETVRSLARLHALSERLDTAMGAALPNDGPSVTSLAYGRAWRTVGTPADRERQIALMMEVGAALDRYTRNPLLRHSLRMMRKPAQVAGVGVLQTFLERGFDTFRDLRGAGDFLSTIASRERDLAARLFSGDLSADLAPSDGGGGGNTKPTLSRVQENGATPTVAQSAEGGGTPEPSCGLPVRHESIAAADDGRLPPL